MTDEDFEAIEEARQYAGERLGKVMNKLPKPKTTLECMGRVDALMNLASAIMATLYRLNIPVDTDPEKAVEIMVLAANKGRAAMHDYFSELAVSQN